MIDSERWKQVDDVLQSVLDRAPEERDACLRQACAGDETLEREVRSLLASDEAVGEFLENPALEVAARAIAAKGSHQAPETAGSLTGQVISHYRVAEKLGSGGMGVVWKARDTRLDRFVALKFLPAERMSDPARKLRFAQEARAASALNHPNIITIYDIDRAGPEERAADFIAMEFVPGKALDQLISRKGLRLKDALHYAIQVADALAAAHAAGIVHRDLKPGNVMASENGGVKVLDFGLAKLRKQGEASEFARTESLARPETGEGAIVGTVSYMSPEQAEGRKVDARTDIFSFGALLYELVTGWRAFPGESAASILSAILRDEPRPAAEIAPGLPRALGGIITRCLQKDPNRRYQHAGDLKIDLQQVQEELAAGGSGVTQERPARLRAGRRWWFVAAACLAVLFITAWGLRGPQAAPPPWKVTQLTIDPGLSDSPALSPDGKLVAYSSDSGPNGERDLYVKQVAGGQPVRLTTDGAGNTTPDFSPDGGRIVFRSNRNGGGIYEIPAFGGDARLVTRDGLNPRFSPDGSQVAYWVGTESVAATVPGSGTVWVVPSAAGGQPRRVGSNFTTARSPIWSPDGKRLLLVGYTSAKAYEGSSIDWWLADINGADAIRTGVYEALVHAGLQARDAASNATLRAAAIQSVPRPWCWSAAANQVIFSMPSGDSRNLWQIGISSTNGKVGAIERLTTGAGNEVDPACASGTLAFTSFATSQDVWLLPLDLKRGTSKDALERITQGPAHRQDPSLSSNGRYAAYNSDQSGRRNIWLRELATGQEWILARSPLLQRFPVSNASGTKIAFSEYEKDHRAVYASAPGGAPEKLCEDCLRATDWSRDDKSLLVFAGNPYQINLLDAASHRQTPLLKHPTYHLLYGRFSPDNRWVSFTARVQPSRGRIAIAPVDGIKPIPESAWITIAEAGIDDWAEWSPDGKTLYFTSGRDGYRCLWARSLEGSTHRLAGEPFAVRHFHGRLEFQHSGWSAGGGRIALALGESTGNIWMMSRPGAR